MLSEHEEQVNLINWCDAHPDHRVRSIYAHMNGVRTTIGAAMKAKAEGARAGIPDLFLPVPNKNYSGLYLEMKRIKNSVVSPVQKERIAQLNDRGYLATVCYGADAAMVVIEEYLECNGEN